jgi:hypothetical protein
VRARAAVDLFGLSLTLSVAGCAAFLSDDWRIVASDASLADDTSAADPGVVDAISSGDARAPGDSLSADGSAADRTEVEAEADIDAADGLDAVALDAARPADAAREDAPSGPADSAACTPFPPGTTYSAPAGCSGGLNQLPAPMYLWAVAPWGCSFGLGTTQSNTPVECQCQETYNCACVMAHRSEINLCTCPTCGPVAYSCAETAGVPRLVCPQ